MKDHFIFGLAIGVPLGCIVTQALFFLMRHAGAFCQ